MAGVFTVLCVAVGLATHRYIERPLARLASGRGPSRAAVAQS
jgi:peptidoglycan/LPS O-acetylase OafA/YrhL